MVDEFESLESNLQARTMLDFNPRCDEITQRRSRIVLIKVLFIHDAKRIRELEPLYIFQNWTRSTGSIDTL